MPGRTKLLENIAGDLMKARASSTAIEDYAKNPHGRTVEDVTRSETIIHEAVSRAAEAARVLVREGG